MPPCPAQPQNTIQLSPPHWPAPAHPTLSHRGSWGLKEFILKWNGNWKKFLFSYGKNLIKHLFLLISVHDSSPECFLQPICSWSYKTDLFLIWFPLSLVPVHLFCLNLSAHLLTWVTLEKIATPLTWSHAIRGMCIIHLIGMAWFPPRCSLSADTIVF